ncbi:MAG: riboflavin synthase [Thaumarchaeota archaeon]|nr:riboflavin synthase [Nitrososphaerota archaeon]MBI3640908.1 riboflavin synthase [Nitrososphaerota archaeon]
MFTGIIEGQGIVKKFVNKTKNRSAAKMGIDLGNLAKGLQIGDSVAINGVCLTATHISEKQAEFEMIGETLKKTNLGMIKSGDKVNIERSLKVGERMEGHFVLGHIDGTGKIMKIEKLSKEIKFWIELPKDLARFVVKKGSITVDGISLTLVDVLKNKISICIIPHTMKITNLGSKKIGDKVNIETDILGKYAISKD